MTKHLKSYRVGIRGVLFLVGCCCAWTGLTQPVVADVQRLWADANHHHLMADSTRILLEELLAIAPQESIRAEAHHLLGKHHFLLMQQDRARVHFHASKQLFEKLGHWEKTGFALIQLGNGYMETNHLDSAIIAFQEAIRLYGQHDLQVHLWTPYLGLANVHQKAHNFPVAFLYARKAIASASSAQDRAGQVITLNSILRMARERDSIGVLVHYADEYYRLFSPIELDDKTIAHVNYFMHIGNPRERIEKLTTAIEALKGFQPSLELISLYHQLAQSYRETHQPALAIRTWETALSIERDSLRNMYFTPVLLRSISEQYEALDQTHLAYPYFRTYSRIKDSLTRVYAQARVDELQLQYETKEKDMALARQQFVLTRRTAQRNVILLLGGVLVVAGAYVVFGQRRHIRDQVTITRQQEKIHRNELEELKRQHEIVQLHTLVTAQEEERKRIALDLHDSLGGLLATLKMQARKLETQGVTDSYKSEAREHVRLLEDVSAEIRRIAHNMMPPALVRMGLSAAIEDLVQTIHQDKSLVVTYQNIDYDHSLTQDQEIPLYRIVQELCTNVIRHADAQHLLIQLSRHNGSATLVVEDDGKGFAPGTQEQNGLGFESIRSRVAYLGGEMDICSDPGEGTSVTIHIPVS